MGFGSRWSGGGVVLVVVAVCEFELCCAVCKEACFFGFSLLYFGGEEEAGAGELRFDTPFGLFL